MTNRKPYDQWKAEIDHFLFALCGLCADDLPDYAYRDAYDDGKSPQATARAAYRAAQEF